ncbi:MULTISPECIES: hypothetical protein [unclassified Cryobacterium]|uniref:hypothetical protein n=1 Tax=unclassified Cryobacterium TaxID=2649013 RepID=UPI001069B7F7|nr:MULTISPECIES: hypothetical protein [unclassified Cryobacterium]TFB98379.1 hypothetical protein E3O39_05855 [Cryobacterium sp. MDB2-A-1]TFC08261.1 hypothetical protein E3O59_07225 [Cryobacterium sp. MDB2-33-2]TFC08528.1 hypothetical protein E3O35_16530 [Cryobacterium sp. MDB2-A-2]TFC21929.1 hypothetical protein E3O51_03460 [Cryobacterium sp. MDB2-10]
MSRSSLTQQQLDPLGALAAWPLAPAIAAIVTVSAVTATITQAGQTGNALLGSLAIAAVTLAAILLVLASRPRNAPFRAAAHVAIAVLALAAYLLEQASRWNHNALIQDDFGPVAIGLLLLGLAPYRPWRQIAASAGVLALVVAAVTWVQAPFHSIDVAPVVFAAVAVTQVLAPALAGAAYSRRLVGSLLAWQTDARRAIIERTEETRARVVRAVVEQQRTELAAGVLPLLTEVLERGEITKADITRAGALAADVRKALLRELDKTWLDAAIARERAALLARGITPLLVVADPDRRAAAFHTDQRAATAALLGALCSAPGFDPCSLVVQVTAGDEFRGTGSPRPALTRSPLTTTSEIPLSTSPLRTIPDRGPRREMPAGAGAPASAPRLDQVTIQVGIDLPARAVRALLRPYLGVLHVVFGRVRVSTSRASGRRPLVTLEFDAEHGPERRRVARPVR